MIDLELETVQLSLRFQAMSHGPSRQGTAFSNDLLGRLGIRTDAPPIWVDQFSPFTVLFPLLLQEGYPEIREDDAREACLAHLHFLIHTFIEDRHLDGQVELNAAHVLFAKRILVTGFQLLQERPREGGPESQGLSKALDAYDYAQLNDYETHPRTDRGIVRSRIHRIASGRAAYGSLAPLALLRNAGCESGRYRLAQNAFDCVVTGMQWLDDIEDWREDLMQGDENLLLVLLRREGRDSYSHPDNGLREVNVGHALLTAGVFDTAASNARRWLNSAARRMSRTGCGQMAGLAEAMAATIDDRIGMQTDAIEKEVVAVAKDRVASLD